MRDVASSDGTDADELVRSGLRLLREHLGLDVAFIAQSVGDGPVLRYIDTAPDASGVALPIDRPIVDGCLPPSLLEVARAPVPATSSGRCPGSSVHLSVPIVFSDGTVYGTFCCVGSGSTQPLGDRDRDVVHMLAAMVTEHVETADARRRQRELRRTRLRTLTVGRDLEMVLAFQPIVALATGDVVGVEALARFPELDEPIPQVFDDARSLGVGRDLELRAVAAALEEVAHLPGDTYLSVNVGPATLVSEEFMDLMRATAPGRVMVEITEHDAVEDYEPLVTSIAELSAAGVRLAIDDVGTGFSGLAHILRLDPDTLKVDGALIEGIDRSPAKQAMVSALLNFASRVGTTVVAERIETPLELETLSSLGLSFGQGYLFGRPGDLEAVFALRV